MTKQKMTTSWMWTVGDGINALRIDVDKQILQWYDAIGCSCDISAVDQPAQEFADTGVPSLFDEPEAEIMREIEATVGVILGD